MMDLQTKESKTKGFLKSIGKFSVAHWVNFLIGLLTVMVATRLVPPDVYGAWNLFTTTSMILMSISCLGFDQAFIRFFFEPPAGWDSRQLLSRCLMISLVFLSVLFLLASFFYKELSHRFFSIVSCYLVLFVFLNAFSLVLLNRFFSQWYRLSNDAFHFTVQQICMQLCSKGMVIVAALINPTLDTVLGLNTLAMLGLTFLCFLIQRKDLFPQKVHWTFGHFGEVARFALFAWPTTVFAGVTPFLVPFLISQRLDHYAVGIYASAGFFSSAFAVLQGGFGTYWSAFFYKHYKDEQELIKNVHDYVVLFVLFVFGMFLLAQHIVYMIIGPEYQGSRLFFSFILLEPLLMLLGETTSYGVNVAKKNYQLMIIFIGAVICNGVLIYLLLPVVGLVGAAFSVGLTAVIRFLLVTWRGQCYYRTIHRLRRSLFGLSLVISLAISNYLLNDKFYYEVAVVLLIFALAVVSYQQQMKAMYGMMRGVLLKRRESI